jgi:hypothetical protein
MVKQKKGKKDEIIEKINSEWKVSDSLSENFRNELKFWERKKEQLLASGKYKDAFLSQIPGETERFLKWLNGDSNE